MTSPLVTSKIARPAIPLFTAYVAQLGEVEKEKGPVNLFPTERRATGWRGRRVSMAT
ncbi:MAG: hypothetical protein V3S73_03285 [Gammaproteobacteria bacterium]